MIKLNFIKHLLFLSLILTIVNCRSTDKLPEKSEVVTEPEIKTTIDKAKTTKDEHDIIVIDLGFQTWLASTAKAKGFYEQVYLENKNMRYVQEWNARVLQPQKYSSNLYEMQIDYSQNIDYGYDVNYTLYNYFIYFQNNYKQNLLGGRIPIN